MLKLNGSQNLHWNYRDNIAYVDIITRSSGKNDSEYYVYDSGGQRVRKVTETYQNNEKNSTRVEKIYFGDIEVTRTYQDNNLNKEKYTVHVMDDKSRVALHHYWIKGSPENVEIKSQSRYQLSNHLDSVALELNDNAEIMSYEEYLPFGSTALIAGKTAREVTEKEYRYSGKERDESTGLYYYGARYYAPWLARWINPDPAGIIDGLNLYQFVRGNPINDIDLFGLVDIGSTSKKRSRDQIEQAEPSNDNQQEIQDNSQGNTVDSSSDQITDKLYPEAFNDKSKSFRGYNPLSLKDLATKALPPEVTLDSRAAINLYTGKSYSQINAYSSSNEIQPKSKREKVFSMENLQKITEDMTVGIQQMPKFYGVTYRGDSLDSQVEKGEVKVSLGSLELGDTFSNKAFTSSSSKREVAEGFARSVKPQKKAVLMEIYSHSLAASIENISDYQAQQEKLFPRNTGFIVLDKGKTKITRTSREAKREYKQDITKITVGVGEEALLQHRYQVLQDIKNRKWNLKRAA